MAQWLNQIAFAVQAHPLDFGLRAGAIFAVVVGGYLLARWLRGEIVEMPVLARGRGRGAGDPSASVVSRRTGLSRWLANLAFACVLLAMAVAIAAIVGYGQKGAVTLDARLVLVALEGAAKQVIAVLLLVAISLAAAGILQRVVAGALEHAGIDPSLRLLGGRAVYLVVVVVGALVILTVLGIPLALPVAFLSVLTLALSLALQDVMRNIFAGVYLLVERPFLIGDEIVVASYSGRVEDIELRITSLRAADGQRVLVPNSILFTSAVVNATANKRRRAVLGVSLASAGAGDFARAEERISGALERVPGIWRESAPQIVLNGAGQDKLDLRVVFWVPTQDWSQANETVADAVARIGAALEAAEISVVEPAAAPGLVAAAGH